MTRISSAYFLTAQSLATSETWSIGVVPDDLKRSAIGNDLQGTWEVTGLERKYQVDGISFGQSAEEAGWENRALPRPSSLPRVRRNTPARPKFHP